MSKAKRKKRGRAKRSFNPDKIATAISRSLKLDLASSNQMYGGDNQLRLFFQEVQEGSTLKKYDPTDSKEDELQDEAFAKFRDINDHLAEYNWPYGELIEREACHLLSPEALIVRRARWLCRWVLGEFEWGEFCESVTHSSGVTVGVSYSDTSLEAKLAWPISGTKEAIRIFEDYLSESIMLQDAIRCLPANAKQPLAEWFDEVEGSRATTVPKTADKRRMIAIEPTCNMFLQQGLMEMMYRRLKSVGLDVRELPMRHVELARQGSISRNISTIDFSSASDCVSIELLRYLLPNSWFEMLDKVRCPVMLIDGEAVDLEMFSTMGNAGTFPLETLVFWSLGVATVMNRTRTNPYQLLSVKSEQSAVSVFGDDCILPTVDAPLFMRACESVGFLVNEEKSFYTRDSGFRESCGGDYLRGSNMRPIYIKAPTSRNMSALEPWLYTIANMVIPRYISYFGPLSYVYEKELLTYLFDVFRKNRLKVKLVPSYFPDDAGLKTRDWKRLRQCYQFQLDKVEAGDMGSYSFRYCRFVYRQKGERNDYVRYITWLGKPKFSDDPAIRPEFPIRRTDRKSVV